MRTTYVRVFHRIAGSNFSGVPFNFPVSFELRYPLEPIPWLLSRKNVVVRAGNTAERKSQSISPIRELRICFAKTQSRFRGLESRTCDEGARARDRETVSAPRREFLTRDLLSLSARSRKKEKEERGQPICTFPSINIVRASETEMHNIDVRAFHNAVTRSFVIIYH